ncbi:carboxyl transferase [Segniliparus rotundus DSM 44985]|uniref:Carboxyl transferase n=1 Tax=Segniliparus rotundus (strain ATCC BAA-972 / CDC 1076 / CIP 108378 / DSM 44985 / JCM 13578) TaxID=640132 RepID=D6ZED2_SEGRD|nr:acyl-CoA carboxylase subunit beta [Segniliparus rotundus]ADG99408.1 carboxyl transferase [Segniliparus rotundus DSM 44985]
MTTAEHVEAPSIHTTAGKLHEMRQRLSESLHPVGEAAVEAVHAKGKLTARERVDQLLDPGSFVEFDALAKHRSTNFGMASKKPLGDGVVAGYGTVDGREVCVFAQDPTVFGGSLGETHGEKITKIMDLAIKTGRPLIGLYDGGGARIQEGVVSLALAGEIFHRNVRASGVIPQISVVLGAAAGAAVYSPALTDFIVMVDKTSQLFITGPDVIKTVTGEEVTMEDLGGANTHMTRTGTAHHVAPDEDEAFEFVKELLSYLPNNNRAEAPRYPHEHPVTFPIEHSVTHEDEELDTIIPDSPNQPYDMRDIINRIVDDGELLEIQPARAQNVIVGFARVEGRSVGVVANQPLFLAGCLDIDASEKAARFIRTCDAFGIPILSLVDVPGFLPGTDQEHEGIIRRGAKLLFAYGEATVGKITVITRKAYGGAYLVMGSKHMGADVNLAWPTAEIAVMGASGAVNILHRRQIAEAAKQGQDAEALRQQLQEEYENALLNPYVAAERGYLDSVILPSHTRAQVSVALRVLERKVAPLPPKKHGNIPL